MNEQHKSNLAHIAIKMLESSKPLNMSWYFFDELGEEVEPPTIKQWKCGTACCFIGFGPSIIEKEEKFLFEDKWPDSKNQAAARALKFLENSKDFDNWDYDFGARFYPSYNSQKLIEKLTQFI